MTVIIHLQTMDYCDFANYNRNRIANKNKQNDDLI